jgi:hypothetical protein
MYKRPLVVGVRQLEGRHSSHIAESAVTDLERNTGNMMFTESLVQVLEGARWGSFSFTESDLYDRDSIVLASANWINNFEDFGWLADRLEETQLPVFLVGVGAQSSLGMEVPEVRPGTRRLLDLVSDRSKSIAARGRFSCEVMDKLGIKSAQETGCPSLMLAGPGGPHISLSHISQETCCIHSTRHGFQATEPFQRYLYRQAFKGRFHLLLQSELADIYCALGSREADQIPEKAVDVLRDCYGVDNIEMIRDFLTSYGHVFLNYGDWIAFMRTRSFCFGTRIHGTIASLIAGTPATLICHDSRTLEMAESMFIPMVLSTDIDTERDLSLSELFLPEEILDFVTAYQSYYSRYLAYFKENQIDIAFNFQPSVVA